MYHSFRLGCLVFSVLKKVTRNFVIDRNGQPDLMSSCRLVLCSTSSPGLPPLCDTALSSLSRWNQRPTWGKRRRHDTGVEALFHRTSVSSLPSPLVWDRLGLCTLFHFLKKCVTHVGGGKGTDDFFSGKAFEALKTQTVQTTIPSRRDLVTFYSAVVVGSPLSSPLRQGISSQERGSTCGALLAALETGIRRLT